MIIEDKKMSYLGYPRLHFSGGFLADVSTINNTPNNYDTKNSKIEDLELYWNPNGTGIFDLTDCVVTKVVYGPGDEADTPEKDPIIGQTVAAVYSKAPAKLVDLDPDQQNVSEIWGLTMQVAGSGASPQSIPNFLRGDFVDVSFNAIWQQSKKGPPSSASGSAVYQSQLKNISWDKNSKPRSRFLTALNKVSAEQLSVNFVVNAHNNSPINYAFNASTFAALNKPPYSIPNEILKKLKPLNSYIQNLTDCKTENKKNRGIVPTESYVSHEVNRLLGQVHADKYLNDILAVTLQPYDHDVMPTVFPSGLVTGTIGPQQDPQPVHYTPSRTMAPYGKSSICYFAPFITSSVNGETTITLNFGNALATNKPGYDISKDKLGKLTLVYFNQNKSQGISLKNAVTICELPDDLSSVMINRAGILDMFINNYLHTHEDSVEQVNADILSMPLGLLGDVKGNRSIWLAENVLGFNVRADKFVFRMNPGIKTTDKQPRGDSSEVFFYVTKFGQPVSNVSLQISLLSKKDAIHYTNGTLGTSGTRGIGNLSVPPDALTLKDENSYSKEMDKVIISTDKEGIARLKLIASDPGSQRADQGLDGQVYFIKYNFSDPKISKSFTQDINDLISVHIYSDPKNPLKPSWDNCIKKILSQYSKLYPIMGRFQLDNYQSVYENRIAIRTVLTKPMEDALHMPVIRDLSIQNRNTIVEWINNGANEK